MRFSTIFCLKDSNWAPYEQEKLFCKLFRFHEDICDDKDKSVTKPTLFENFEGFSHILRNNQAKTYLVMFTHKITII